MSAEASQEPEDIPLDPEIERLVGEFQKLASDYKKQGLPARTIRWALIGAAHQFSQSSTENMDEHLLFLSDVSRYADLSYESELETRDWSLDNGLEADHPYVLEREAVNESFAIRYWSFFAGEEQHFADELAAKQALTA